MANSTDACAPAASARLVTLDVTDLPCPIPVLKAKKALSVLAAGEVLEVLATDPLAEKDMVALCLATGHELLQSEHGLPDRPSTWRFLIRKRGVP